MSNSLDLVQDCHAVSPELGLNCLQRLSADNKSRGYQKILNMETILLFKG